MRVKGCYAVGDNKDGKPKVRKFDPTRNPVDCAYNMALVRTDEEYQRALDCEDLMRARAE